jgi:hypothetical protein
MFVKITLGHRVLGQDVLQDTLDNQLFAKVPRQVVVRARLQQDYLKCSTASHDILVLPTTLIYLQRTIRIFLLLAIIGMFA